MAEALGTWREARCEGGREPVPSGAGPAGRATDWLPPLGSGPWAGPRWAGLPLALQAWPGGSARGVANAGLGAARRSEPLSFLHRLLPAQSPR